MVEADSKGEQAASLTGNFRVRATRSALTAARRLFPKAADRMEVRSHALKLRYWPLKHPADKSGKLLDLNWDWIKALKGTEIGELRLDDTIGGFDNLRIIFLVGDKKVVKPLPIIWVLQVMQKKRMEWTTNDLAIFKARRLQVIEWFYKAK